MPTGVTANEIDFLRELFNYDEDRLIEALNKAGYLI